MRYHLQLWDTLPWTQILHTGITQPHHNKAGKLSCNRKSLALKDPFMESESVSSGQGISEQGIKISLLMQIRISSRRPLKKSLSLFFVVNTIHSPKIYVGCITWGFVVAFFKQRCTNRYFKIGSRTQNHRTVWVGRDSKDPLIPAPHMGRDTFH